MPVPVSSPAFSQQLHPPRSAAELENINAHLSTLSPYAILQWGVAHLPNLYQTTAFGLTGLAATDMLSKITPSPPPIIFIDTLYHFPETLELMAEVKEHYHTHINVLRPQDCQSVEDFEARHGSRLWETDEQVYDYLVKVEPARRAYAALNVESVITGRRASQGGERAFLRPLEIDRTGLYKLNPFYAWSFAEIKSYIVENNVPRNKLLDQGYKSVGDWHSTKKSGEGDSGERAGRWQGTEKTECGLHKDYFLMKKMMKQKREEELRRKDEARG